MRTGILFVSICVIQVLSGAASDDPFANFDTFDSKSSLKVGYGYAENVLLSELAPVDSAFSHLGLEGIASKELNDGQWNWDSLVYADIRWYKELDDLPEHRLFLLQSELETYLGMISKGRFGVRYLDLSQAFDATFDEAEPLSFQVEAQEPELYLGWGSIVGGFQIDAEAGFSRMMFRNLENDYDAASLDVELARSLGESLVWESAISAWNRSYADRFARRADGGTEELVLLETNQVTIETGLVYQLSKGGSEHEFGLFVSRSERSDPFSGYYDRTNNELEFEWSYVSSFASSRLLGGFREYRYPRQVSGVGQMRESDAWFWELEVEHGLSESWSLFLNCYEEDERSSDELSSYRTRGVLVGLKWH